MPLTAASEGEICGIARTCTGVARDQAILMSRSGLPRQASEKICFTPKGQTFKVIKTNGFVRLSLLHLFLKFYMAASKILISAMN